MPDSIESVSFAKLKAGAYFRNRRSTSDSLEDTAWRPDCLGRREGRGRWDLVLAQAHPCQWLHSSSSAS